jgi:hypothetical protein
VLKMSAWCVFVSIVNSFACYLIHQEKDLPKPGTRRKGGNFQTVSNLHKVRQGLFICIQHVNLSFNKGKKSTSNFGTQVVGM